MSNQALPHVERDSATGTSVTNPKEQASAIWDYITSVRSVRKRDGSTEDFDLQKLERSIHKAFEAAGISNEILAQRVIDSALARLIKRFDGIVIPTADQITEIVGVTLIDTNLSHVAKRYIGYRVDTHVLPDEPVYGRGIRVKRFYTKPGVHPYDEIEWETRDAVITNHEGKIVFEQKNVEVPKFYSQSATNIVVSKYFRGRLGTPQRETSVRQMVDRVAKTITSYGRRGGYFMTEDDAATFEAELTSILVNQRAAFNSPVWFNVGVNPKPQCSACFINSVYDDMRSILGLAVTEGMLFKYGSGAGSNLSWLRSSREKLGGSSGLSSGPVSFMKGLDAFAGVIKSGGKTRRAAKMVILDVEHPDVLDFAWCKAKEEKKAHTLIDAGYDGSLDGEAYASIFFQNANNSIRVTDDFMQGVEQDKDFWTKYVLTKEPCERFKARELMKQISEAAWQCGDPGIQYDTTVNDWHTCANTDRIYASNPCSEYMFLNDTACNLASTNLMKFRRPDASFDAEAFKHTNTVIITAQEIVIDFSSYPTPAIEQMSWDYRTLGLGYANLGALLMSMGLAYDSDRGRNLAAALTSIMSGVAYEQSSKIAEKLGTFRGYARNEQPMLRVMRKHRDASYRINAEGVPQDVLDEAKAAWDRAVAAGEKHGFRNAQISVLAPTGTIGFLMDCQTTGVEPPIALVSYKWLVGGGMMKLVNETVPEALHTLGYRETEIRDILDYISANDTIEGAPHLKAEHMDVFDCAFKPAKGKRSIHYMGHLKMMGAVQPFISGAISKTVNMPANATVEEVMDVYMEGWRLGLKAVAIYRDGCKRAQPLTTTKTESKKTEDAGGQATAVATAVTGQQASGNAELAKPVSPTHHSPLTTHPIITTGSSATGEVYAPRRRRLPEERRALTHKFQIGAHEGYITVGLYEDGTLGEVFITMNKEGSTLNGLLDSFATSISVGLQYGVPLKTLVNKFAHVRFEPSGFTPNPNIRMAKSIVDYIFRWLGSKFLSPEDKASIGLNVIEGGATTDMGANLNAVESLAIKEFIAEDPFKAAPGPGQTSLLEQPSGTSALNATFNNQSDAPACDICGSIMVRSSACYKCLNCGTSAGCS
jgi:ribonucleoside-diphosphate reductase alpha chain